ncbi:MAG: alpha/beta hydrolase fold domain-containing protein [Clostridiales bacterium]|nr:MAG: alpha/beta hydrolase fold domain-containing protein [Clostridiales bacterium]
MRRTYCYEYAKKGVVVANIDYIWAPLKQFPYPVQDVLDAIDFLFDNAERLNIDTSKIIFGGESAGVYFGMILNFIAAHFETLDVMGLKFRHAKEFKNHRKYVQLRRVRYAFACIVQVPEHGYYGGKPYRYFHKRHKRRALRRPNQCDLSRKKFLDENFAPTFIICAEKKTRL